jgi:hypothetical protein
MSKDIPACLHRRPPLPPPWLDDADTMRAMAAQYLEYFNTSPDPLLGVASGLWSFRVVHRLGGSATYYNSDCEYAVGEVVSLGNAENTVDGQAGELRARILGAEVETPAEYRHYMTFRHTYPVLVD